MKRTVWFGMALTWCMTICASQQEIVCEGEYGGHLQGVATDGQSLFWSFTVEVVRTDLSGKVLATSGTVPRHHGDLCVKDGVVYVAVNLGRFNQTDAGKSEVYSYDAATMKPLRTWPLDMPYGAGGMTFAGDRFFIVGGLPATIEENYVYEYDGDFQLVKRHALATGFTLMGIQTAAVEDGRFLFGIYGGKGNPAGVLVSPRDLSSFTRRTGHGSVGIVKLGDRYWTGRTFPGKSHRGKIVLAPGYPESESEYVPKSTGKGELRAFFGETASTKWRDCGYELIADGYRPLTAAKGVFVSMNAAKEMTVVPAVELADRRTYSTPDLVRGIRRVAECDEMLAVHLPTRTEMEKDETLSSAYEALVHECKALGVPVNVVKEK